MSFTHCLSYEYERLGISTLDFWRTFFLSSFGPEVSLFVCCFESNSCAAKSGTSELAEFGSKECVRAESLFTIQYRHIFCGTPCALMFLANCTLQGSEAATAQLSIDSASAADLAASMSISA